MGVGRDRELKPYRFGIFLSIYTPSLFPSIRRRIHKILRNLTYLLDFSSLCLNHKQRNKMRPLLFRSYPNPNDLLRKSVLNGSKLRRVYRGE